MAKAYEEIAKIAPSLIATRLALDNLVTTKKKKKKLVSLGVNNIIGASLIQANAQFLGGL